MKLGKAFSDTLSRLFISVNVGTLALSILFRPVSSAIIGSTAIVSTLGLPEMLFPPISVLLFYKCLKYNNKLVETECLIIIIIKAL